MFRGGRTVGVRARHEYDEDDLVTMMLDRKLGRFYPPKDSRASSSVALRVRGLQTGRKLRGVDLDLHQGEILGIGGLQGQGQTQLFLALYGALRTRHGTVELFGEPTRIRAIRDALNGKVPIALVPEDRRNQGLLLQKSVRENLTLSVLPRVSHFGIINRRSERKLVQEAIDGLGIVARSQDQDVRWLSGGNQQKIILAKLLLANPRVLLLFDPTRGVDVGTKAQIFELMRDLARQGYALLFHSTDASELVNIADRVAVMIEGRIAETVEGPELTEESLVRASVHGKQDVT